MYTPDSSNYLYYNVCSLTFNDDSTYIYAYVHTYIRTYIHTDMQKYTHTYLHTYIHTYYYQRTYSNTHTHKHTYTHKPKYIHTPTYNIWSFVTTRFTYTAVIDPRTPVPGNSNAYYIFLFLRIMHNGWGATNASFSKSGRYTWWP